MSSSSPDFDIVRTAHVEYLVRNLEKSRRFYVDTLGLVETESTDRQIFLRGLEDRFHHSVVLTKSSRPGVGHISFRLREEAQLQKVANLFEETKLPYKWVEKDEEQGQGRALRAQDPLGFPVEFFFKMEPAEWLWQKFNLHIGARIMRLDHVNLFASDVQMASDWYVNRLGFVCTEYTETEGPNPKLWGTWLKRKPTVHDVALMTGEGPRLHHTGLFVNDKHSILDTADKLAASGYLKAIERGPGRHGISNAFFLYLRDPDGHRIELYTGDYLSADPDWKPIKWKLDNPQRQTFWGARAPESWFKEASTVKSIFNGKEVKTSAPVM
jgi:catechol 2,3-dioxygenase